LLKAVIFDMDGVIIDSEPQHAKAAVLTLKKYNVNIPIDYIYTFIGSTTFYMCQKMSIISFVQRGTK
jgi:beta-phosphoglucomutase-like phosphatase (HAD superfamily)